MFDCPTSKKRSNRSGGGTSTAETTLSGVSSRVSNQIRMRIGKWAVSVEEGAYDAKLAAYLARTSAACTSVLERRNSVTSCSLNCRLSGWLIRWKRARFANQDLTQSSHPEPLLVVRAGASTVVPCRILSVCHRSRNHPVSEHLSPQVPLRSGHPTLPDCLPRGKLRQSLRPLGRDAAHLRISGPISLTAGRQSGIMTSSPIESL